MIIIINAFSNIALNNVGFFTDKLEVYLIQDMVLLHRHTISAVANKKRKLLQMHVHSAFTEQRRFDHAIKRPFLAESA